MSAACPYCRGPFEAKDAMQVCPSCATPHHKDCFLENGGCTVFGCVSAPGDEPMIRVMLEDLPDRGSSLAYAAAAGTRTAAPESRWQPGSQASHGLGHTRSATQEEPARPSPFGVLLERAHPAPPSLPWALLLFLSVLSSGLFLLVWEVALARWMREVQPHNRAVYFYSGVVVLQLFTFATVVGGQINIHDAVNGSMLGTAMIVFLMMGRFSMKMALEDYFDQAGAMGLRLSDVLTFLFGALYFQYHLNHLDEYKDRYKERRAQVIA